MLKKIKIKIKKNLEIIALSFLVLITIIFTSYYNYNKKFNSKQQLQYKNKLQPAIEDTSDPPIDNPPYLERRMNLSDSLLSKFHLKTKSSHRISFTADVPRA